MNKKIVWLGDSITLGVGNGVTDPQCFASLVSSSRGATYINKGVGGNTSSQMLARFNTDVISLQPAWVAIEAGDNDAGENVSAATFEANYRAMIESALQSNIKVCLITPNLSQTAAFQQVVPTYNSVARKLAKEYGISLVDIYERFTAWSFLPGGATFAGYYYNADHPSVSGHAAIAEVFNAPENLSIFDFSVPETLEGIPAGGTTGQVLTKLDADNYNAGWVTPSGGGGAPNVVNSGLVNPAGTGGTNGVMAGIGLYITPNSSGVVEFILSGALTHTGNGGGFTNIRYGTGTAPVNGAAPTGILCSSGATWIPSSSGGYHSFCVQGSVSGLTLGTRIWVDAKIGCVTANGVVRFDNAVLCAKELS